MTNVSRSEQLEQMAQKYKQLAKQAKAKEKAKERKERAHRLIRLGGLIEMVIGHDRIDKGIIAGLIHENKNLFDNPDKAMAVQIKCIGDKLIDEHTAKKDNEGNQNAGTTDTYSNA